MPTIKVKNLETGEWEKLPTIKGDQGEAGIGLPTGGTAGQILSKKSDTDYETEWTDAPEGSSVDLTEVYNAMYPIGRGFIDFTNTDYSNYLGFTWERELVGMFPVGYNSADEDFNTIGKTGGEKEHLLTIEEMPSHTHIQNPHTHTTASNNDNGSSYPNQWLVGGSSNGSQSTKSIPSTTAVNQNTGGDTAHNNLPPYQVVAYWKRIA